MKETPKSAERELKKVQIGKVINDKISTRMPSLLMLGLDLPFQRCDGEKHFAPGTRIHCRLMSQVAGPPRGAPPYGLPKRPATGGPVPSCSWPWGTNFRNH